MEWLSSLIDHQYMTYVLMYYIVCILGAVSVIFKSIITMETQYVLVDGWVVSYFKLFMVSTFFPVYAYWIIKDEILSW